MKNIHSSRLLALLILSLWCLSNLSGQSQAFDAGCFPTSVGGAIPTTAFFNYGNSSKMKNATRRTKLTIGQTVIGFASGDDYNSLFGFWSALNIAPLPPVVTATQGELADRIQISWSNNPLGAFPTNGFKIYRDGVFLAAVDKNTRNYNDFNIIAGRNYTYTVRGINLYGEGPAGAALGFQVPNGVATGWVRTLNGNAVPNAQVTLSPMQGFSTKFGQFDGAVARAGAGNNFFPTLAATDWTLSFWARTNAVYGGLGTADILRTAELAVRANASGQLLFVVPGVANGTETTLTAAPAGGNDGSWHQLALTFSAGQYRLYLDGLLVDLKSGSPSLTSPEMNFGKNTQFPGWDGGLDEFRIYHRRLDELDLTEVIAGTASSLTPNLKYYWKMDEGAGTKSFDILNRHPLFFCGAIFDSNRPPVATSGVTNLNGYYRIEGANYGTGTTFLATPKKDFYKHRSLKFLKNESDRAALPDFGLTEKSTLELWVNQSETSSNEVLLHKSWGAGGSQFFVLQSLNGTLRVNLNGAVHDFGALGFGYQHLALTIARTVSSTEISVFKNGNLLGSHNFGATTGDWSEPGYGWNVGAVSGQLGIAAGQFGLFFGGLVDELAVYDTTLSQTKIQEHVQNSRNAQEKGLRIYFAMDEGTGSKLSNSGSALVDGFGTTYGTEWTVFAPNQETMPHIFSPGNRQVTLNPSVTSVDQVDFTDRSTVAVSGFVRYQNTDCFADQVEILVNGETYKPIILTDSTGKFVIDLEPGTSVTLRPKFKNHTFFPEEIDVLNVVAPVAGIVFNDITTREISGRVVGGECKKSIILNPGTPTGTVCRLRAQTLDECFKKEFTISTTDGQYNFEGLPPLEMTIAVIEHSDPDIQKALELLGVQVDLSEKEDTVVHFTYYAPPEVELSGLNEFSPTCPTIVLNQYETQTINIKVKETYLNNEVCYLDTAAILLINGFEDSVKLLTLKSVNGLNYTFKVGAPVASPPFLKTLQVVATTITNNETSLVVQALVTGIRSKQNTFTTTLPQVPSLVLHDPPGDGSHAYFEKEEKVCQNVSFDSETTIGVEREVEVELGPELTIQMAPFGIGTSWDLDADLTANNTATLTYKRVDKNTLQTCTSFKNRIQTGDNQLIVGSEQGGDVFVGTALNLDFGFADKVKLDTQNCAGLLSSVPIVEPGQYPTTFVYSEFSIRENVIRYLDSLILLPNLSTEDSSLYNESKALWVKILNDNKKMRDTMTARQNISFDAGANYEYSSTSDTLTSSEMGNIFEGGVASSLKLGFKALGLGISGTLKLSFSTSIGETKTNETQKGITTGYVLADDDMLDMFSVDVGIDPRYKTPIFRTKAGQSSCPWEPNTAHREANSMEFRDGSGAVAVDVPSKEPAVFKFTLGNNSETNETFTYALSARPESNPHGAKISVNGTSLTNNQVNYMIPFGASVPVTVTVERGPVEYNYDNLEIVFYSVCEFERANGLGIDPSGDTLLYSPQFISARFLRPCSEVEINVPEQNWAIFPDNIPGNGNDNIMRITASGYDKSNVDFEKIRIQYRRSTGDGTWTSIVPPNDPLILANQTGGDILRDNLGANFTQFYWDTDGLNDGDYEIRAIAICSGNVDDQPGYSQIIKGRIDRQPPSLLGTPQPSDGVYQVGDEISFKFNKNINCQKINSLDNVLLFDATTGLPVNIDISCKDNQIILDPRFDNNSFFENKIFRAELHDIEDLTGNLAENPIQAAFPSKFGWEFYVDRNELAWLTDRVSMTKTEDEVKSVTASIHNRGGYPVPFTITGAPDWVRVVPNTGTMVPNEVRTIRFEVDSTLAFGLWTDSVTLHTETGANPFFMGGDEHLPIDVRVVCQPPQWNFDAGIHPVTMNMVVALNIEGTLSTDEEDIVAAFINDELRGRASIRYYPTVDKYLAHLTIFGESVEVNAPIQLQVWDASACLRYGLGVDTFTFQPDNVLGTPVNPKVLFTDSHVLREIPLNNGWNWISFNLAFPDPAINPVLASLKHPANDVIKGQTPFAEYFGGSWFGSLNTLENTTMYQFRADQPDTIKMAGNVIDPTLVNIPLDGGWNWMGYLPNYPLAVNEALGSLNPASGDLIKGQYGFAQYIAPFGWIGNLNYLVPPQGYQIRLTNPGTLNYPPRNLIENGSVANRGEPSAAAAYWNVDPAKYENSMTLVGMLARDGQNTTLETHEIGVFAGDELRGSAQAIYVEPTGSYLFFLTAYSNGSGEQLRFSLYDAATGQVGQLVETTAFAPQMHQGSIQAPVPFTTQTSTSTTGGKVAAFTLDVQPNPFNDGTLIRFNLVRDQEVQFSVTDLQGREIQRFRKYARPGWNALEWQPDLSAGVYFLRLQTTEGVAVQKVVKE